MMMQLQCCTLYNIMTLQKFYEKIYTSIEQYKKGTGKTHLTRIIITLFTKYRTSVSAPLLAMPCQLLRKCKCSAVQCRAVPCRAVPCRAVPWKKSVSAVRMAPVLGPMPKFKPARQKKCSVNVQCHVEK